MYLGHILVFKSSQNLLRLDLAFHHEAQLVQPVKGLDNPALCWEYWVENMVNIARQQVEEALTTSLDKEDQTLVALVSPTVMSKRLMMKPTTTTTTRTTSTV